MSRRGRILTGVAVALAILLGLGWWRWYLPTRYAVEIGTAMLAKQVCSCVFIAERGLEPCRADQFPSMDAIQVELLHSAGRVRAFVPGFGERSALHRSGLGCTLEPIGSP